MINLIETPQRSDIKADYTVNNDVLTVTICNITEVFDFTGLDEGKTERIIADQLLINPVLSAEKIGDVINVKVIRYYGFDEKELFENV